MIVVPVIAGAALAPARGPDFAEASAGDRVGAAVTSAVVIAAPIGVGLATLSRRPDRFAAILVAAGALFSLTVLAQSHDPKRSTASGAGIVVVWVVEVVVVYLLLSFPSGRLHNVAADAAQ